MPTYYIFRFAMVRDLRICRNGVWEVISSFFDWETSHWNRDEAAKLALLSNPYWRIASVKELC